MNLKDAVRTLFFKEEQQTTNHQLYTKWGEELNLEQVWREYPRPQLIRDNYTILNGYWDYSITKESIKPTDFDGKILVPFSPECSLSGVNRQLKPEEYLWYQRTIRFDEIYKGMRLILHFGAVDQSCEVYLNSTKIAEHSGGYLPFSIDITKDSKEGDNLLTLRVVDQSNTSYHSRGKQKLDRGGMFYTAQSGIWQTVWYEWVPDIYITGIKITPNVEKGEVTLQIDHNKKAINWWEANREEVYQGTAYQEVDGRQSGCKDTACQETSYQESADLEKDYASTDLEILYQVVVKENGVVKQSISTKQSVITLKLEEFIFWSPENPFLYAMTITAGEDKVESYFAMRSFELKKDTEGFIRIFLNQKPYFQNGLLDQGYWPDGLYTAPSDEAMIFDIEQAKRLGFNMLRKHIKIEPLRWYYHCDRLGMLVWQDMVNGGEEYNQLLVGYLPTIFPFIAGRISDQHYRRFGRANPEGRREWSIECKETVEHLYNCPSIAVWVPFNEGWGQFDAKEAYRLIRELDSTRLIDHASGWYDQGIGDFESIHNYFHPLKVTHKKRAVIFSEIGGYACYTEDHSFSWQVYGYRIYLTKEDLNHAYQKLYREEIAALIMAGLSAVVYTQLSDVEDEVNGLFTYDRKVCKVTPLDIIKNQQ